MLKCVDGDSEEVGGFVGESMCVVICWSVCCRMMAWYLLAFWSATRMLRNAVGVLWTCLGLGSVIMVDVFHW